MDFGLCYVTQGAHSARPTEDAPDMHAERQSEGPKASLGWRGRELSVNTGALMLLATRHIKYFWKCKCFVLQEDPLLEILQLST